MRSPIPTASVLQTRLGRVLLAAFTLALLPGSARAKKAPEAAPRCEWMKERIAAAYTQQYGHRHYSLQMVGSCPPSAAGGGGRGFGGPAGVSRPPKPRLHFTGTNNRVATVDEADTIKSNGHTLFALRGSEVVIVQLHPAAKMKVLSRIALEGPRARSLLLAGDRLLVVGEAQGKTVLRLFDVGEPAKPRQMADLELEGRSVGERTIGDQALLVISSVLKAPEDLLEIGPGQPITYGCCDDTSAVTGKVLEKVRDRARKALARFEVDRALPRMKRTAGGKSSEAPLLSCEAVKDSAHGQQSTALTAVVRIDLRKGVLAEAVGLLDEGGEIYATPERLYLSRRVQTAASGRRSCSGVARPPEFLLQPAGDTVIHRFGLGSGSEGLAYEASGRLSGRLLNPFSIDEHQGYLRVALTASSGVRWRAAPARAAGSSTSNARLVVLAREGERLETVGTLENMAPGETIFAARFMGDLGYVVTFPVPEREVRIDPLFTLDLSKPKEPRVVGELEIPGFSNYLHPFGPRRLVAIGQDADRQGNELGAHLQVFDLSNLARPRRTSQVLIGARSEAQFDHHAFLADPEYKLVAVPVRSQPLQKSSLVVYRLEGKKLKLQGNIDHVCQAGDAGGCEAPGRPPLITRSLVVEDHLYSLSEDEIRAHRIKGLKPTARLRLGP